jgi:protein-S-isoprenylcysteine O-methyltransferase Ste14
MIVDNLLIEPLPFRDAGRLMALRTAWPVKGATSRRVTGGDFQYIRSAALSFSNLAFYGTDGEGAVRIGGGSRFAHVVLTSPAHFLPSWGHRLWSAVCQTASMLNKPPSHQLLSRGPYGAIRRMLSAIPW